MHRRRGADAPHVDAEAHFITGFVGSYDAVKTIADLGFASHDAHLQAFEDKLADSIKAGYILAENATAICHRAALCPPLTFTETYRDHYEAFIVMPFVEGLSVRQAADAVRSRSETKRCCGY